METIVQYAKCDLCDTLGTSYDCFSIMHYRDRAFSANGGLTMTAKDPSTCDLSGPNRILTSSDVDLVRSMYQCSGTNPPNTGSGKICLLISYWKNSILQNPALQHLGIGTAKVHTWDRPPIPLIVQDCARSPQPARPGTDILLKDTVLKHQKLTASTLRPIMLLELIVENVGFCKIKYVFSKGGEQSVRTPAKSAV